MKTFNTQETATAPPLSHPKQRRRRCKFAVLATLLLLLAIIIVGIILGVTVFKVKPARTQVASASLEGVAPRISFPAIKVELNITLNLTLLIQNRNHASFKSDQGEGVLLYQGDRVGDTQLHPGLIPARGTSTLICLLTVEVDRFANSGLTSLFSNIADGELRLETKTRIPGRVTILKIFHKHIVSASDCQIVIGFPDLKIKSQDCKNHNKF
ncbi:uncharacterized protein LOC110690801 [Chenopodium quinoa]|uniref:Late embryogenesis abundant protein LEA-2 subgroup domain-containing protein n=1 Tax=Chenopodium quinoa TaxID=63459 RepID=A0A803MI66_CHEQI|nr:uncharacterized protein LOC110690801 [Chenopodium quinoa]